MTNLKGNPEQVELLKKIGSANRSESLEAQSAFAAFMAPVVLKAMLEKNVVSDIYRDIEFDPETNATFPLDLYFNENAGYVSIWSQTMADGLATNMIDVPVKELQLQTYTLTSAISFMKKHAMNARLDVVAASMEWMVNEFVHKQNINGWNVILAALAAASAKNGKNVAFGTSGSVANVVRSTDATLQLKDLSDLVTRSKRINTSYAGGTPVSSAGITDLYMSPEVMGEVREFSFNPIRSDASASTSNSTNLPASQREKLFAAGGAKEFMGYMMHELNELGKSQLFNTIFDSYAGSNSYTRITGASGTTFDNANDQIIVGIDASAGAFRRPVAINSESKGQLLVAADDQFTARSKKVGFYAELDEAYLCLDARKTVGLLLG